MPNEQNLIPMDQRSQSEAREQGAAGAGGMQDMDDDPITASLKEEMGNGLL